MDIELQKRDQVLPDWMRRWEVARLWTFDYYAVSGRQNEQGFVASFHDGRVRGLYKLGGMEADLAEQLGCRVALLTLAAVEEVEDAGRKRSILGSMMPLNLRASDAA